MDTTHKSFIDLLSSTEIYALEHIGNEEHFSRKSVIFKEGTTTPYIYIIRKGIVKTSIQGSSGHEHITRIYSQGDIIGYQSFLSSYIYPTTATAMSDVETYSIGRQEFLSLIKNHPSIQLSLFSSIAAEIKQYQDRMFSLAYHSVPSRIADAVLNTAVHYGYMADGKTINGPIYRKDLAEYAGVTIESTIRTLGKMKKKGIISIKNKHIIILDLKELTRISHDE